MYDKSISASDYYNFLKSHAISARIKLFISMSLFDVLFLSRPGLIFKVKKKMILLNVGVKKEIYFIRGHRQQYVIGVAQPRIEI